MKILRLLSKFFISLFVYIFFINSSISNEPVDIWNIEKTENVIEKKLLNNKIENIDSEAIQEIKIGDQNINIIVNDTLSDNDVKLAGLYDPAENGLSIDMWSYSNGKEIKNILKELNSKKLSNYFSKSNYFSYSSSSINSCRCR